VLISSGVDGWADEGWTKVNLRRGWSMSYGPKLTGHLLLIGDADTVYGLNFALKKTVAEKLTADPQPKDYLWKSAYPGWLRTYAMALSSNTVVFAGKTVQKDIWGGFISLMRPDDGSVISSTALPAPVIHQGIAIAYQRIYVSLSNGSVVCLGQQQ